MIWLKHIKNVQMSVSLVIFHTSVKDFETTLSFQLGCLVKTNDLFPKFVHIFIYYRDFYSEWFGFFFSLGDRKCPLCRGQTEYDFTWKKQ